MRVLLQQQHDFYSRIGGAETQFHSYVRGLKALGVEVDVLLDLAPRIDGYDLVHCFNVCNWRDSLHQMQNAKRRGKPVFFSSVYWNAEEIWNIRHSLGQVSHEVAIQEYKRSREQIRHLVDAADFLLPNSHAEYGVLAADALPTQPYWVVRNGVDPSDFEGGNAKKFTREHGVKDFVLSVGRVELRKNTLALIQAMQDIDVPLVIVGDTYLEGIDGRYGQQCKASAEKRKAPTLFLSRMNKRELAHAYAAASVFALPSWFETPGLATMEAALFGCRCVVGDRGAVREYFTDQVEYCNPANASSIRDAILRALQGPKYTGFAAHLFEARKYTWEAAAGDLVAAYKAGLELWGGRNG